MVNHVPLQLRQIHGTPGAEGVVIAAPFEELFHDIQEIFSLFTELIHGQMRDFRDFLMQFFINMREDQPLKLGDDLQIVIQLDCSDLDDLEGKAVVRRWLVGRTLVPLEIHDNIVMTHIPIFLIAFLIYTCLLHVLLKKLVFFSDL